MHGTMNHVDQQGHDWVRAAEAEDYSATLTGNPFMFREARILLELLLSGATVADARTKITDGNLFQYRSVKSITKRVNALASRLEGVPRTLLDFIRSAPVGEARLVLLIVLAVRDRLFREFLQEVVVPLMYSHDTNLSRAAVDRFFDAKAAVSPKVASWGPQARTKLRTVFVGALTEVGVALSHEREVKVRRPVLSPATRDVVQAWFPPSYQSLIGGSSA
jgi:hypothetical protein